MNDEQYTILIIAYANSILCTISRGTAYNYRRYVSELKPDAIATREIVRSAIKRRDPGKSVQDNAVSLTPEER